MNFQMADGTMLDPNSIPVEGANLSGMQVDGGLVTPPNEVVTYSAGSSDFGSLFFSQVDGADDDLEEGTGQEQVKNELNTEHIEEAAGEPNQEEGPDEHVMDELEPMESSDLGASVKDSDEQSVAVSGTHFSRDLIPLSRCSVFLVIFYSLLVMLSHYPWPFYAKKYLCIRWSRLVGTILNTNLGPPFK